MRSRVLIYRHQALSSPITAPRPFPDVATPTDSFHSASGTAVALPATSPTRLVEPGAFHLGHA